MGAKKKAVTIERTMLEHTMLEHEPWEGALALAKILDLMVEGTCVQAGKLIASLDSVGVSGERVIAGLVSTGLVELHEITITSAPAHVIGLTREGRLAVIHATSSL